MVIWSLATECNENAAHWKTQGKMDTIMLSTIHMVICRGQPKLDSLTGHDTSGTQTNKHIWERLVMTAAALTGTSFTQVSCRWIDRRTHVGDNHMESTKAKQMILPMSRTARGSVPSADMHTENTILTLYLLYTTHTATFCTPLIHMHAFGSAPESRSFWQCT